MTLIIAKVCFFTALCAVIILHQGKLITCLGSIQTTMECSGMAYSIQVLLMIGDASQENVVLRSHCICPGYPLLAECTVVGSITGTTVWRGSAFNCAEAGNEISLLHGRFLSSEAVCNSGLIVGRGVTIQNSSCYTSQLQVMINSVMIGRTIECVHDNVGSETTIDSLTISTVGKIIP